ncbi:MAG: undecaprenyl/decaprenyl-phosphate alpha-N-acetylglucosaminyl 1-phosphate transferase [bacterium]|nr:undecaprenyl/decaprenyl-phosphate alpha-N-acetylglucosaminyl 1-phosphate transferase [bacterium]
MTYFLGFLLAFLLSIGATKLTIKWANKYGFVDNPKRSHSAILHDRPIPRAGGVPVYVATLLTVLLFSGQLIGGYDANIKHLIGIFLAGAGIVILGLFDDKYDLSAHLRLWLMFLLAIVVVGFGIGITFITNPLGGVLRLDDLIYVFHFAGSMHSIVIFADILAIFWIVSLMNVVNWSSGLDGQNAGIAMITLAILGFSALRYNQTSEPTALLAFIASGAYAGFLLFSAYPQKIMPGFGGSTFSGFMIAVLSILSGAKLATALIVLAIPILDSIWVVFRRIYNKQNPLKNTRTHLHHYLLDIGWSKRRIAFFYWLICAILGILVLQINSQTKLFVFLVLLLLFLAGVLWLQRLLRSSNR